MQSGTYQVYKFLAGIEMFKENSGECRGSCYRILFLYTPDLHAHMLSFNYNGNSQWFQCILNAVPDLGRESFLNLESS